jgi:hypothetical protein
MGAYSGLLATELDSHANMAVAGSDYTIIAKSGNFLDVTPFSADLPVLQMVEIGDAMMAYDDPFTFITYLLVMKNALLIPSMDHNLIPPFLLQEAGLTLDEMPKHQMESPTIDNHVNVDEESGMRVHLQLNRIFSFFPTRNLIPYEVEHWNTYPIVFLTPDGDSWYPNLTHYVEQEAYMLDSSGLIAVHEERPTKRLFTEADLGELYATPGTWEEFYDVVDSVMANDIPLKGSTLTEDESVKMNHDGIRADFECDLFLETASAKLESAFSTIAAVTAGRTQGVSTEHLSKVWMIPHDEAAQTLKVTSQHLCTNIDSSLSRNVGTNDRAVRYCHIKLCFYTDTLFVTGKAKNSQGNICAQLFVSDKGYVAIYPMKNQQDYFFALMQFAKDVGAPDVLVCDPHPTQRQSKVKEFCTQIGTTL